GMDLHRNILYRNIKTHALADKLRARHFHAPSVYKNARQRHRALNRYFYTEDQALLRIDYEKQTYTTAYLLHGCGEHYFDALLHGSKTTANTKWIFKAHGSFTDQNKKN